MNSEILFFLLSGMILVFSILTVTTRRILRAAVYLLFVLVSTAGLYFMLNYNFLAAVQLAALHAAGDLGGRLAGADGGFAAGRQSGLGCRCLAGLGQLDLWLCRLGLAAAPLPGRHHHAHGAAGAAVPRAGAARR